MPLQCCSGTKAEAEAAAQSATAAVFYSVSSTQKGLAGVDLGHFLIEKVRAGQQASPAEGAMPCRSVCVEITPCTHGAQQGKRGCCMLQVAHKLMSEFPNLRRLATLSPLPRFRSWLETQLSQQLAREPVCY